MKRNLAFSNSKTGLFKNTPRIGGTFIKKSVNRNQASRQYTKGVPSSLLTKWRAGLVTKNVAYKFSYILNNKIKARNQTYRYIKRDQKHETLRNLMNRVCNKDPSTINPT